MKKSHLRNIREMYKKLAKTLNSRQASHLQTHSRSIPCGSCLCPAACCLAEILRNTRETRNSQVFFSIQKKKTLFPNGMHTTVQSLSILQMASPPGYLCRRNTKHLPQKTSCVFTLGIATVRTDLCIKCATPQLSIHSRVSGFKDFSQHALVSC